MWKVIGVLSDSQRARGNVRNPVHGPMPRKVWIADGKRYRVGKPSNGLARKARDMSEDKRLAVEYARWLAKRDGIDITADHGPVVHFAGVNVNGRHQSRPCNVLFRGYHGAASITIELPNWNWVPADPVEQIMADETEFALAA